jgi:hypothetical protein
VTHTYRRRLTATAIVVGVVCAGTPALAAPAFAAQKRSAGPIGPIGTAVPANWIDRITRAQEVNFAESHWSWTAWNDSTPVAFGSGQPSYQCAEFVARSMAAAGLIPGLSPDAPQDAYFNYTAPNGKVYDLLLISPLPQYNNIYAYLMDSGVGIDVGDDPAAARPGDFVVTYLGFNGESSHMGLVATAPTATTEGTVDAHNNARYHYGYHYYAPSHLVELAPNALLKVIAWAAKFHKAGATPTPKAVTPNQLVNSGGLAGPIGPQV